MSQTHHHLPAWAQSLLKKHSAKTTTQFILYNNVHDFVPLRQNNRVTFAELGDFLAKEVFKDRSTVIFYDISKGVYFIDANMQSDFFKTIQITQQDLMKLPSVALKAIEIYVRLSIDKNKSVAIIIDHAETVVPATMSAAMSIEDRKCLVMLKKWANDTRYLKSNITVCLITDNLADLNNRIVRNSATDKIEIDYPQESERLDYIRSFIEEEKSENRERTFMQYADVSPETIAHTMAGLNRRQLKMLVAFARENNRRIDFPYLVEMKKEIIEEECFGLLEIIEPRHTLDAVAGYEPIKVRLRNLAAAIKKGKLDAVPMGYLFSGPVGTGKTFIVLSFVGEIGIPCVKFMNFREQWQGVTEANLEKILNLLRAMWPIGVIIDEADAFLGNRDQQGDSGTSNRVFASLVSFMGDTSYRGKVIWFLITCRPDLLPIDMKRQGRAEEHISVFYPDTEEEKELLFQAMVKKTGIRMEEGIRLKDVFDVRETISGADMEALVTRVKLQQSLNDAPMVSRDMLKLVFEDFVPTNDPESIELQNLAAVIECTSKSLLPTRYANADRAAIRRQFDELRALTA
jgi:AAA+ superfamily predicted ATPase